jgi:anti-anti-sigma regulatory factor
VLIDANKIIFQGDLRAQTKGPLACIYQLVQTRGYKDIVLDFSAVRYVDANTMLPLSSYAAYYRMHQIDFSLIEPADPVLKRLFTNTNWAHFIDPQKHQMNNKRRSNNLPALQFQDGDAQYDVVNRAMDVLLETIKVSDRTQMKALEWSLNEITDNVLNHAESPIGGLVQIQCFPVKNRVSFYVADVGVGIPATLRKASPNISSDSAALDRAIREGVTRNSLTNQGNGLYGTFKCCEVSGGAFDIYSNNAELHYNGELISVKTDKIPFRGAFISATINYATEGLLEKALVFKGKVIETSNDYIDLHYANVDDKIQFEVIKEVEGFGSREFGRRARSKIDNILVDKRNYIVFDFTDIPLISSSFADEAFGKLFAEMGAMEFMRRCSFKSVDSTVMKLIDRAISQRMKMS